MHPVDPAEHAEFHRVLLSFFRGMEGGRGIISTSDAIRVIRQELPDCADDDRALAEVIARRAISQGYDVSFD